MSKKITLGFLCLVFHFVAFSQIDDPFKNTVNDSDNREHPKDLTKYPEFDLFIQNKLDFSVPIISVGDFKKLYASKEKENILILDTRSEFAFNTSHIPGAERIGFDDFSIERVWYYPRDSKIVVYCTLGVKSEKVGKYLETMGFTNVQNLYGSIIEWTNQDGVIVNAEGKTTRKIIIKGKEKKHFLKKGKAILMTKDDVF